MQPLIFVDGTCVLCNGFAAWVLKRNSRNQLKLGALQGNTAAQRLPLEVTRDLDSIVLLDDKGLHQRSTAVLRALIHLGGVYRVALVLFVVPRCIRDMVYNWIARHRYQWFGHYDTCRLPEPHERTQILD